MIFLYTLAAVCIVQFLLIILLLFRCAKKECRIQSLAKYITELFDPPIDDEQIDK